MTLNIRLVSATLMYHIEQRGILQSYVSVKNAQNQLIYNTKKIKVGQKIQWTHSESEQFCAKSSTYYQFQFYDKQKINQDDYVALGHFYISQIEVSYKKLLKKINLKQKYGMGYREAGTLTIQIQFHQGEPVTEKVNSIMIGKSLSINEKSKSMSSRNTTVQKQLEDNQIEIINTQQSRKTKENLSLQLYHTSSKNFNIITCLDDNPVDSQFVFMAKRKQLINSNDDL